MMKSILAALTLIGLSQFGYPDTFTPNIGLVQITTGTVNWGGKLNQNFSIIDSSVHSNSTGTAALVAAVAASTNTLQANINAEAAARQAQDTIIAASTNTLQGNITTEAATRLAADQALAASTTTLDADLTNEASARHTADLALGVDTTTIQANVTAEAAARAAGDLALAVSTASLRSDLTFETNRAGVAESAIGVATNTLRIDLTTEANARTSGDTLLGAATGQLRLDLSAEAGARASQDVLIGGATAQLHLDVLGEASARQAQDAAIAASTNALQGNIASEAVARAASDALIGGATQQLKVDINSEASARIAQDAVIGASTQAIVDQKGAAGGIASLDGAGKVPYAQLPSALMTYKGSWSAATNTPALADGGAFLNGDVYRASAGGTVNTGHGPVLFYVGDFIIYNGSIWERSPMADGVQSVNSFTGAVSLVTTDIPEGTHLYFLDSRAIAALAPTTDAIAASTTTIAGSVTTETSSRIAADALIGGATQQLHLDVLSEASARAAQDIVIGASTASLRSDLTTETSNRIAGDNALAVSTTSIAGTVTTETSNRITADALIGGTTQQLHLDITAEATSRAAQDTLIADATTTLHTEVVPISRIDLSTVTTALALKAPLSSPLFTGNVGINDSAPSATLDIQSNAAPTGYAVAVSSQDDTHSIFSVTGDGSVLVGTNTSSSSGVLQLNTTTGKRTLMMMRGGVLDLYMGIEDGSHNILSGLATGDIGFRSYTSGNFAFGGTSGTPTVYFKDGGNVGIGTASPCSTCTLQVAGTIVSRGVSGGTDAGPGEVGEYITASLGGTQTPGASGTYVAVATVTLTAGDWDVWGTVEFDCGATTAGKDIIGAISSINNSLDTAGANNVAEMGYALVASVGNQFPMGPRRVSINSSTPYYLIARVDYTVLGGGAWATSSIIRARRVR